MTRISISPDPCVAWTHGSSGIHQVTSVEEEEHIARKILEANGKLERWDGKR
jgi:hypothetical protein